LIDQISKTIKINEDEVTRIKASKMEFMKKFSNKPLKLEDEGKISESFYEEEKTWYGALIKKVDPVA